MFGYLTVCSQSRTPVIEAMTAFTDAGASSGESAFVRGAVHDLTDKLSMVQQHGKPFFLYAHILAPHPPIRFRRDCSIRAAAPDLLTWDPKDKPAFLEQLICVNNEAMALAGAIVRSDPEAIIVLQSRPWHGISRPVPRSHSMPGMRWT